MTNNPSIGQEMKSSFCLATSLFIYFPSSWVYMHTALNGQCIKMPLFIFFSFTLLPIMAIIWPLEARKYHFCFPRWTTFVYVCSLQTGQYVKLYFSFFLWYRLLHANHMVFQIMQKPVCVFIHIHIKQKWILFSYSQAYLYAHTNLFISIILLILSQEYDMISTHIKVSDIIIWTDDLMVLF